MSARRDGHVFVLIGPSGAGKTTLAEKAREAGLAETVVTCTTRPPRPGERDGVDYHFLPPAEFEARYASGEILERERIHENWYGAPAAAFRTALRAGKTVVVPLGFEGGRRVKSLWPENVTLVYVLPPSVEELRARLVARGTPAAEIERRLHQIEEEMRLVSLGDAVIRNDDLDRAFEDLRALLAGRGAGA